VKADYLNINEQKKSRVVDRTAVRREEEWGRFRAKRLPALTGRTPDNKGKEKNTLKDGAKHATVTYLKPLEKGRRERTLCEKA